MRKNFVTMFLLTIVMSFCASCSGFNYPSDYRLYVELSTFKAPVLSDIKGDSYRLVWHAWHQRPGLIIVNRSDGSYKIQLRYTDGYGTYYQGKLIDSLELNINEAEFNAVAEKFILDGLNPDLREEDYFLDNENQLPDENGTVEVRICLHAPHYYLERYVDGEYQLIFRYCQDNYVKDLEVAFPLIELAEKYFRKPMENITAQWIREHRKEKNASDKKR